MRIHCKFELLGCNIPQNMSASWLHGVFGLLNLANYTRFEADCSFLSIVVVSLDEILEYGILPTVAVLFLVQKPLILVLARFGLLKELWHR